MDVSLDPALEGHLFRANPNDQSLCIATNAPKAKETFEHSM